MRRSVAEHQLVVSKLVESFSFKIKMSAPESVSLEQSLGRVLAADLRAPISLPPFDNSQMDGFAVALAEKDQPKNEPLYQIAEKNQPKKVVFTESTGFDGFNYSVVDTIAAGVVPARLGIGEAAPIMTGAMMPEGASTVVPIEQAIPSTFPAKGESVWLPQPKAGTFVRERGSDLAEGTVAIPAGTLINAAHVGLISALGLEQVEVRRMARVLLVTTGDEVLLPGDPVAAKGLPAGKIFDANMALLRANLHQAGLRVEVADVIRDKPAALTEALQTRLAQTPSVDLIISTGGISAGAFEVVKQALHGTSVDFVSVAMQPGGPQASGVFDGVPFLGFPGNPVSAVISFEMFLRPALSQHLGGPKPRPKLSAQLREALHSPDGKHQVRRGIMLEQNDVVSGPMVPVVVEVGGPSSHLLASLAKAEALIHLPVGVAEAPAGSEVEVWLL